MIPRLPPIAARIRLHRRWLHEPLLQFVLAGGLLFVIHGVLSSTPERADQGNRIELTQDDLRQLLVTWIAQGRPPPTPEQMRGLVEQKVTQEILFREAVALGLDKEDEIIKRRLAQKMDFLAEDVAASREPRLQELKAWFGQNAEHFVLPARVTFRHLYFSFDRRGAGARDAAAAALEKVADKSAASPEGADPFMFQDYYGDRSPDQLAKEFGPGFARALFELRPGSWQGPIQSGYGWHLVWIDQITPGRVPAFEEVEPDIRAEWLQAQHIEIKRRAFAAMRARYTVVVPPLEHVELPPAGGRAALVTQ
jgi:peptidyl-prolyl cis-trans isomerase C